MENWNRKKTSAPIFGAQNGGAHFLIYVVKETDEKLYYVPTHLFEYNGKAYKNITDALKVAVKDYISRERKTISDVIKDFECIYERQKYHQHVFKDNAGPIRDVHYSQTPFAGLYIRDDINQDKLTKINEILGNGFGIKPISDQCYHELLLCGDDTLWDCYDKSLFNALKGTSYYYRKDAESRIEAINSVFNKYSRKSLVKRWPRLVREVLFKQQQTYTIHLSNFDRKRIWFGHI